MFRNEIKRLINQKWLWIMLVVCLFSCLGISFYMRLNLSNKFNYKIYSYYMAELEGDFTYEKYLWIQSEYKEMQTLVEKKPTYQQQYFSGLISEEEYKELEQKAQSASYRLSTMEYIVEKSEYLKKQYDKGINCAFFDDLTATDYLKNQRLLYVIIVFTMLFASFIALEDWQNNMHMLINSSLFGRTKLQFVRVGVFSLITIILCVMALLMEYFVKIKFMNLYGLNYVAGSIIGIKNFELLSIGKYIFVRALRITGSSLILGIIILLLIEKINRASEKR